MNKEEAQVILLSTYGVDFSVKKIFDDIPTELLEHALIIDPGVKIFKRLQKATREEDLAALKIFLPLIEDGVAPSEEECKNCPRYSCNYCGQTIREKKDILLKAINERNPKMVELVLSSYKNERSRILDCCETLPRSANEAVIRTKGPKYKPAMEVFELIRPHLRYRNIDTDRLARLVAKTVNLDLLKMLAKALKFFPYEEIQFHCRGELYLWAKAEKEKQDILLRNLPDDLREQGEEFLLLGRRLEREFKNLYRNYRGAMKRYEEEVLGLSNLEN